MDAGFKLFVQCVKCFDLIGAKREIVIVAVVDDQIVLNYIKGRNRLKVFVVNFFEPPKVFQLFNQYCCFFTKLNKVDPWFYFFHDGVERYLVGVFMYQFFIQRQCCRHERCIHHVESYDGLGYEGIVVSTNVRHQYLLNQFGWKVVDGDKAVVFFCEFLEVFV